MGATPNPLRALGAALLDGARRLGRATLFFAVSFLSIFTPPLRPRRVVAHLHFIGVRSLSVIVLTALFTGMVLGLQGYYTVRRFGAEGLLGAAVALGLIRELGPVLAALMVTARAGSAIAAELGIMRISEQIDALEVMGIDPVKHLVTPRLVAAVIALPLLTAIFDVVGIGGAWLVGVKLLGVDPGAFMASMRHAVEPSDLRGGMWKALSFGAIVAWVSSWKGYTAGYGAEGVGRATTEAVVTCSVLVLVWDYFLTSVLFPS